MSTELSSLEPILARENLVLLKPFINCKDFCLYVVEQAWIAGACLSLTNKLDQVIVSFGYSEARVSIYPTLLLNISFFHVRLCIIRM